MTFEFPQLDNRIRAYMLDELILDRRNGFEPGSSRLTEQGERALPRLIESAFLSGTPASLAAGITWEGLLISEEPRKKGDQFVFVRVPSNAATMIAESIFNQYYIRAICRRAIFTGEPLVQVIRAKQVKTKRSTSEFLEDKVVSPVALLKDLRSHDHALGIPGGPNSGISVMIPEDPAPIQTFPSLSVWASGRLRNWFSQDAA